MFAEIKKIIPAPKSLWPSIPIKSLIIQQTEEKTQDGLLKVLLSCRGVINVRSCNLLLLTKLYDILDLASYNLKLHL